METGCMERAAGRVEWAVGRRLQAGQRALQASGMELHTQGRVHRAAGRVFGKDPAGGVCGAAVMVLQAGGLHAGCYRCMGLQAEDCR